MEKNLLFSFDDEVATGFYYDIDGQKIVVYFASYYDKWEVCRKGMPTYY